MRSSDPFIGRARPRRLHRAGALAVLTTVTVLVIGGCVQTPRDRYYQARNATFEPSGAPAAVAAASAE